MNTKAITELMSEWKDAQLKADALREQITAAVLESGTSIETLEVSAKLNPEKHYHNYQAAVEQNRKARRFLVENFLKIEYLDPAIYHKVCDILRLDAPVDKVYAPTVTLRVK